VATINYILFDNNSWENFLPLTFTKPLAEIRFGILTIKEKWEHYLKSECSYLTKPYLGAKYKTVYYRDNILINSSVLPNAEILSEIQNLNTNEVLVKDGIIVAARNSSAEPAEINEEAVKNFKKIHSGSEFEKIEHLWQLFKHNGEAIVEDFRLITKGRKTANLSNNNNLLNPENIFIEEGVKANFVTINASSGPVYIGKDTELMEGSIVRGPFALCEQSILKIGAKIYGPTTIGPFSRVGGEVNNSIITGYSNKSHDGFLGNSIIGEWCNLGADTNNSNLKNNYADVKLWNYGTENFEKTGLQFCGLIMGDHSKCGINTMFNTGTVVGVSANIFGTGFPRNFIPSFSWGGFGGFATYLLPKAIEVAQIVMARRNIELTDADIKILEEIFNTTSKYRQY